MAAPSPVKISVAGIGAYTPVGTSAGECWRSLLAKRTAVVPIDRFPLGGVSCALGGQVAFRPGPDGPPEPATAFALAACREALAQSKADPARTALLTGSNFATLSEGADALAGKAPAASLMALNHGELARRLAERLGIGGPVASVSLSCASGAAALALAGSWIEAGHAETVLVVGADALSLCAWSGLCSLRTIARDGVLRPFDKARAGTVFSEGACAVVLTKRADLVPLAELSGWATGNNGFHLTAPAPRAAGSLRVMRDALRDAKTDLSSVGYVAAHATSTKANDLTEAQALEDLRGPDGAPAPVTAMKACSGHLLGAAGIFEAAMAVESLAEGAVPPVARKPDPDPDLPPLDLVTEKRPFGGAAVLTDCAGFGGCNASLVLSRPGRGGTRPVKARGRIAVLSRGFLSALGTDPGETAAAWEEGEPACFPVSRFEPPDGAGDGLAGEVPGFDPDELLPSPKAYLDRQSLLLLCAASLARKAIGEAAFPAPERFGTFVGTSWGAAETLERFYDDCLRKGPRLVKPMLFPHSYANAAASLLSIEWGLGGSHMNFAGGTNASSLALLAAMDDLRARRCDAALAGGSEALSAVRWRAEAAGGKPPLPPGEAGAVFCLERDERDGRALGAPPLAYLAGGALARSAGEALRRALADAGAAVADVARLYTTVRGAESQDAFGPAATIVPERLTGDCAGATGAVLLACAMLDARKGGDAMLLTTNDDGTAVALVVEFA